jgi:hypothetical protein
MWYIHPMKKRSAARECILLPGDKILKKFKNGEFPDKTFSKLYARWLTLVTLPGIVLEVHHGTVDTCYYITPDNEDFPLHSDVYCVQYDFRAQFKNIEQWMEIKKVRPGPTSCSKYDLEKQIKISLEKGNNFTSNFFLIATISFPKYPFILSTVSHKSTFIEYSESFEAVHGSKNAELCILQGDTPVRNDPDIPCSILTQIADATRRYTSIIGSNTTCEFFLLDDIPCLLAAQKRSIKKMPLSVSCTENVKTITPGVIRGTIKKVSEASVPDIVTNLTKNCQKYVFLADKPFSELVGLLQFADGFIFNEGSMLCHLAILLRERGIPARIIRGSISQYEDGDTLVLE